MPSLQKFHSRVTMIEAILMGDFSTLFVANEVAKFAATFAKEPAPPTNGLLQAKRKELEALPDAELALRHQSLLRRQDLASAQAAAQNEAKARAGAIAKEAAQFYNQPDAQANFDHWSKAEYWTFDEAIALLLGKSPKVLTPKRVEKEIRTIATAFFLGERPTVPPFLRRYEELYDLARRAQVMNKVRMHPAVPVVWARKTGAAVPPEQLVQLLEARAAIEMNSQTTHASQSSAPGSTAKNQSPSMLTPPLPTSRVSVQRSTKDTRRDLLSPVIEDAQARCRDRWDLAEVWAQLLVSAEQRTAPLLGATEKGIQYLKDGEAAELSLRALRERLKRAREKSR
jgi:hypothetical protein